MNTYKGAAKAFLTMVSLVVIFFAVITASEAKGRTSKVRATDNGLQVEFELKRSQIANAAEFETEVVFTNVSKRNLRLNALFLRIPKVLLDVRQSDGKHVPPGPPPMPPVDDGTTGRIILAPGQSTTFQYRGPDYFGLPLTPGHYQVRFTYENMSEHGDWNGKIQTEWLNFTVHAGSKPPI